MQNKNVGKNWLLFYHSISALYKFLSAQMFAFFSFFLLQDQIAFEVVRVQEVEEKVAGLNIRRVKVM